MTPQILISHLIRTVRASVRTAWIGS